MSRLITSFILYSVCVATSALAAVSIDDIIKMVKAGLGEDIIIGQLAKDHAKFDLNVDDLLKLKAAAVPEKVIRTMVSGPTSVSQPTSTKATVDTELEI